VEPVADGTHGFDPVAGRAELGAQPLHVHVHGACLDVRLRLPDRFEQMGARLHALTAFDQSLQQFEFGRGELDFFPVCRHAMSGTIEDDRTTDQAAAGRHRRRRQAPQDRPHTQHQLLGRKRLGEIVVGTEGEALDAVGLVLARRQQQHADVARLVPAA